MNTDASVAVRLRRRWGHLLGLALFLLLLGLWIAATWQDPGLLDRDWVAFDDAGWRAIGGHWSAVYSASADAKWPYLYPPFTIYLSLPLGLLPYLPSYLAGLAMALAALVWAGRRLASTSLGERDRRLVFVSTMLCAPTVAQVLVTGQYSWIYLTSLAGATAAWHLSADEGRAEWRSGLFLAGLLVKPNIAIVFVPLLIAQRRWRSLKAMAVGGIVALAITLPFGPGPWSGFLGALRRVADQQNGGEAPMEKQATLLSFLQLLSGGRGTGSLVWLAWMAASSLLVLSALWAWRSTRSHPSALRVVGLGALLCVAVNPRLYFYDALVLVVPAAGWYLDRGTYRSPALRRLGGLSLATVVVSSLLFFGAPPVGTLIGPACALWLLAEALDLRRAARSAAAGERPAEDVAAEAEDVAAEAEHVVPPTTGVASAETAAPTAGGAALGGQPVVAEPTMTPPVPSSR